MIIAAPPVAAFLLMDKYTRYQELIHSPHTLIMGVLNVTPDSFSDGGKYLRAEDAVHRVGEMLSEGADIIDIGGQSTRPPGSTYGKGAEDVTAEEEGKRVFPVIEAIAKNFPNAIISIDTTKAEIARRSLELGASIINDVSGATQDPLIADVAASMNAPLIIMHGYGPEFAKEKIEEYNYSDVVQSVYDWLNKRIVDLRAKGIKDILADIGFGFAKAADDNIRLLREHDYFSELGVPLVLGVSRKSTIG
ncbi:MAG TPA: dihydropteroate synthase, partial [Candidatus Kapabacteria bacterium]